MFAKFNFLKMSSVRAYILRRYQLDNFLIALFDKADLFNSPSILKLEDDQFLKEVNKFFLDNIQQFREYYTKLQIDVEREQEFVDKMHGNSLKSILTPGQTVLLETLSLDFKILLAAKPTFFNNCRGREAETSNLKILIKR